MSDRHVCHTFAVAPDPEALKQLELCDAPFVVANVKCMCVECESIEYSTIRFANLPTLDAGIVRKWGKMCSELHDTANAVIKRFEQASK